MSPMAYGFLGLAIVLVVVGFELDLKLRAYLKARREAREGRADKQALERRIVAVGDEAEQWLARQVSSPVPQKKKGLIDPRPRGPQSRRFEPNEFLRMRCPGCGAETDAWTNEDGYLEDPRDYECRENPQLPCWKQPTVPVNDE